MECPEEKLKLKITEIKRMNEKNKERTNVVKLGN